MVGKKISRFLQFSRKDPNSKNQKENHEGEIAMEENPNLVTTSSCCTDANYNDGLKSALSEQLHEFVSARILQSDMDLAFRLQMQEAMSASLALLQPSTSSDRDDEDDLISPPSGAEEDVEWIDGDTSDSIDGGKPLGLNWTSRQCAEIWALLNGALSLDFKWLIFFFDYFPNFQFDLRRWTPKSFKITALVSQVLKLQKKCSFCHVTFAAPNDFKSAFEFARELVTGPAESSSAKTPKENCVICLEETDVGLIFSVDGCLHRYCFSCMKQYVEAKLLQGMLPKCPHEGCKSELNIDSCRKFLTPKLIEIMGQRLEEASIPATEKVYCPYSTCSALMSKTDLQEPGGYQIVPGQLGARRCTKCSLIFCIKCKVPWHNDITCTEYRHLNPYAGVEETLLRLLARINLWRQCVKCKHMIELSEGCYHIICRCGYEFCYNCGAKWENKRATCSCPLWDEENLFDDEDDEDNEDEDESDSDDEEEDESDSGDEHDKEGWWSSLMESGRIRK